MPKRRPPKNRHSAYKNCMKTCIFILYIWWDLAGFGRPESLPTIGLYRDPWNSGGQEGDSFTIQLGAPPRASIGLFMRLLCPGDQNQTSPARVFPRIGWDGMGWDGDFQKGWWNTSGFYLVFQHPFEGTPKKGGGIQAASTLYSTPPGMWSPTRLARKALKP